MITVFVLCLLFVAYTYALYPLAVIILGQRRRRRPSLPAFAFAPVAVVIPAYNEGKYIARKIRNVLASTYPAELLQVCVVSDGSTDDTVAQACSVDDPRVRVLVLPQRGGKVAAINLAVSRIDAPILILTDAAELFDRHAIGFLVEKLADPEVGAVSGELRFIDLQTGFSRDLGLYWQYETGIRAAESKLSSMVGVTGAIYAIRRECFTPIAPDTILDDMAIPLEVVRQGRRVEFNPYARAYEIATADVTQEFMRKRRTLAGNYQLLARYWDLLVPFKSPIALQLLSHKVFRLFVPYALLGMFISSFFLPDPFGTVAVTTQVLFYGAALSVHRWPTRLRGAMLSLPYTFCALNWAALAGSYYYFAGLQSARWEKAK